MATNDLIRDRLPQHPNIPSIEAEWQESKMAWVTKWISARREQITNEGRTTRLLPTGSLSTRCRLSSWRRGSDSVMVRFCVTCIIGDHSRLPVDRYQTYSKCEDRNHKKRVRYTHSSIPSSSLLFLFTSWVLWPESVASINKVSLHDGDNWPTYSGKRNGPPIGHPQSTSLFLWAAKTL